MPSMLSAVTPQAIRAPIRIANSHMPMSPLDIVGGRSAFGAFSRPVAPAPLWLGSWRAGSNFQCRWHEGSALNPLGLRPAPQHYTLLGPSISRFGRSWYGERARTRCFPRGRRVTTIQYIGNLFRLSKFCACFRNSRPNSALDCCEMVTLVSPQSFDI